MLSPRPSVLTAPSIWYADVAAPQRNEEGNFGPSEAVETLAILTSEFTITSVQVAPMDRMIPTSSGFSTVSFDTVDGLCLP
jgi:hypothetical protein